MKQEVLEKRIQVAYSQADKRVKKESAQFLKNYQKADKQKQKDLKKGVITQGEYDKWLAGQKLYMSRNEGLIQAIEYEYSHAGETAAKWVNGELPSAYVNGYNDAFTSIGNDVYMEGISYSLIDKNATKVMLEHTGQVHITTMNANGVKHKVYVDKKVREAVTQGIITGKSVNDVAKRIAGNTSNLTQSEYKAIVRNTRTVMNGAHNAGGYQAMQDATDMGVIVDKQWIATHDERTRDSHAHLDGEIQKWNKPFSNGLKYPQDPNGAPEEVYNCRCSMIEITRGFKNKFTGKTEMLGSAPQDEYKAEAKKYWQQVALQKTGKNEAYYTNQISLLEDALKATNPDKVYSGIWKNDVQVKDYAAKKDSIQAKRDYYTDKLATETNPAKIAEYTQYLKDLDEFEKEGQAYLAAKQQLTNAKKDYAEYRKAHGLEIDKFSQERKDNALWFTPANGGSEASYKAFAEKAGEAWNDMTTAEKEAIYDYTGSYHKFNEPLRGIEYGTNKYLGVGNVDMDEIGVKGYGFSRGQMKAEINAMTDGIAKSTYDEDIWLNRGVHYDGMDKFFNCDMDLLQYGTTDELRAQLLNTRPTEHGFMSCGSARGSGFSGDICLNIYAPSGTEMVYVEPISHYGEKKGIYWNGKPTQNYYPHGENEMIINRETQFEVIDVYRENGKVYFDLQIIAQTARRLT